MASAEPHAEGTANPDASGAELTKLKTQQWKELPGSDRKQFTNAESADQLRYKNELLALSAKWQGKRRVDEDASLEQTRGLRGMKEEHAKAASFAWTEAASRSERIPGNISTVFDSKCQLAEAVLAAG